MPHAHHPAGLFHAARSSTDSRASPGKPTCPTTETEGRPTSASFWLQAKKNLHTGAGFLFPGPPALVAQGHPGANYLAAEAPVAAAAAASAAAPAAAGAEAAASAGAAEASAAGAAAGAGAGSAAGAGAATGAGAGAGSSFLPQAARAAAAIRAARTTEFFISVS